MVGKIIRAIYHEMQRHYPTFRILVWLKEKGITRRVNHIIGHSNDEHDREHPTEKMLASQKYFNNPSIKDRVDYDMQLLEDDRSRAVMGGIALQDV